MDKTSGYRHSLLEKLTKSRLGNLVGHAVDNSGAFGCCLTQLSKHVLRCPLRNRSRPFFLVWSRNQTFDTAPAPASVLKYVHISHVKFDSYSLSHEAFDPGLEAEDTFPHPSADLLHFKKTFSVSPSPSFMSF